MEIYGRIKSKIRKRGCGRRTGSRDEFKAEKHIIIQYMYSTRIGKYLPIPS